MPEGYYHELPKLEFGTYQGYPRVYGIALELIAHTEGQLDLQNMELMIREYQSVEPLTLGELWAWPVMLRVGLLESVRRMALRTKRDVMDAARRALDRSRPGDLVVLCVDYATEVWTELEARKSLASPGVMLAREDDDDQVAGVEHAENPSPDNSPITANERYR